MDLVSEATPHNAVDQKTEVVEQEGLEEQQESSEVSQDNQLQQPRQPLTVTPSLMSNKICSYIQVTIPEIGASRDGAYMLYTLFISVPHLRRSWTVSRRYSEFDKLDKRLKELKIEKKSDGKTFDCQLPPKTPFYADKTDGRLTRNRRRQLEAYLWERVNKENLFRCRELAVFLAPHLVWVDDSDVDGINGLYVEREERISGASVYTRAAPFPSTTLYKLKRERYIQDSEDEADSSGRYDSPALTNRKGKKSAREAVFYWELETELNWGGGLTVPLYANRSTASDTIPPEEGWHCCADLPIACSNHTIVCRFDSPWIEWKDILDALITLPEQDSHKSHDEMLQDIMKPNFRSGNLKKLGRVRKNWLERFFVLDFNTGLLEYYTIDGAKLKGCLDVRGCEVKIQREPPQQPDGAVRFVLNTVRMEGNRSLKLEAKNKETAVGWVQCIQNVAIRHVIEEESRKRVRIHSGDINLNSDD